jgi:hypothetical protein
LTDLLTFYVPVLAIAWIARNGELESHPTVDLDHSMDRLLTIVFVFRSGAAYTANVVVPRTNFKVTKGQPKDYDATGASGKINKHWFCANCGSSLYTE